MDLRKEKKKMLPPYANKATKETLLCLSGSKGFCETLLKEDSVYRNKKNAEKYLKIASENLQLAINQICYGLDENQFRGIIRFGEGVTLTITPKSNHSCDGEDYIVSGDSLKTFLYGATSECTFCSLEGKEAKECPIRKALLESLVVPKSEDGDCPYKIY